MEHPINQIFSISFEAGLPHGEGPWLFLANDGSIHAGELLWTDNALSPTGKSQVIRTTNPTGGLHAVFDIPASKVIGHAYAGPQHPFALELPR